MGSCIKQAGIGAFLISAAFAQIGLAQSQPLVGLYGGPGLLDTPTAEVMPDGQLSLSYSDAGPTQRNALSFQILPRVSGTVRYSTVQDFGAPGTEVSDRSFDLAFLLAKESGWRPAVALGFRDFLGTSPFGGEYLVATKSFGDYVKVSAGLGWGRYGSANGFSNIFGRDDRPPVTDPDGRVQGRSFFKGDNAAFGGIAIKTPIKGLSFLAELSSDDYTSEQAGGLDRSSDVNVGLAYQPNENIQIGAYYLHGSTFGFQVALTGNPMTALTPQDLGTGPSPVLSRADDAPRGMAWARKDATRDALMSGIAQVLATDGIVLEEASITASRASVAIRNTRIWREPKAIGRTARVLASVMPASVEQFDITIVNAGLPVTTATILRSDIEAQVDQPEAGAMSWETTTLTDAQSILNSEGYWASEPQSRFTWSFNPTIPFSLFDPDEAIELDALLRLQANYQVTRGLSVSAAVSRWVIGSDQETTFTAPGPLDPVRSDSNLFFSGKDLELDRLTLDYVFKVSPDVYARASAGHFERMYGGVSGEVLWQPVNQSWGLGAELNYARKRDFDDFAGFADFDAVTGHASLYWDTGYKGIAAQVDAGRYLAGDWGATFTLSRRFANGWDVSAYFTRTDVSAEDYGGGSFSKGVSLSMPLRWGLPYETKSTASIDLGSLRRDGGARLTVPGRLYGRVRDLDAVSLERNWASYWQ